MQKPTNLLKFINIKQKFSKAFYIWRMSHCTPSRLTYEVGISIETARRWERMFKKKRGKNGA